MDNTSTQVAPIEDSELVLEEVFRHTPIGVILSDLHGSILDVNNAFCALLDYDRSELVGRLVTELAPPEEREDIEVRLSDLRNGRRGSHVVTRRYLTRRGDTVPTR